MKKSATDLDWMDGGGEGGRRIFFIFLFFLRCLNDWAVEGGLLGFVSNGRTLRRL